MQKTTRHERRRGILTAFVLFVPMLLGACAETPETTFDWPGYDQRVVAVRHHHRPPHPTPRYASIPSRHPVAVAHARSQRTPGWYQASTPQDVEPAQAIGEAHFQWPVQGHVILAFGVASNGERNDGINIAARMDAPIHASDSGTVIYADAGPKGYGNLVLIRHGNGYTTTYAHADRLAVAKGDRVVKGQIIGYAGQTGGVKAPQLHFEIRHQGRPLDPRPLLATVSG